MWWEDGLFGGGDAHIGWTNFGGQLPPPPPPLPTPLVWCNLRLPVYITECMADGNGFIRLTGIYKKNLQIGIGPTDTEL